MGLCWDLVNIGIKWDTAVMKRYLLSTSIRGTATMET